MADFTKWKRKDFGDPFGVPLNRAKAEEEANQDVQKPIQQLLCDVHEQAGMKGIGQGSQQKYVTVRMASMMARVALEHERNHKALVLLTWVIAALTVVLVVLTLVLICHHG